jgi:superfamily I DNA/RNA helicase
MTRARQQLYLSWVKRRRIFGQYEDREISPFLKTIGTQLLQNETPKKPAPKKKEPTQVQMKLF